MTVKEWITTYKGANPVQDPDPVNQVGVQENLDDTTDETRSSQIEEIRDKVDANARLSGDSVNAPVGSLAEILDRDHANGDARQVRMRERASAPAAVANKGFIYCLDDGGVTKWYAKWSDGTEILLGSVANDSVTNAKLANMVQATIKGRASGAGTGDPVDLTAAQATAILDVFTSGAKGLVPASGGGTTNFLRADGSFAAPGGGGSATNLWRYMTTSDLPTGASAVEGLWQFDGTASSLDDRTANGHDWTASATVLYTAAEGLVGLSNDNDYYLTNDSPAGMETTDAYTAAYLLSLFVDHDHLLLACQKSGEKTQYQDRVFTDNKFRHYHQSLTATYTPIYDARPVFGPLTLVHFTRDALGTTYNAYADGQPVGTEVVGGKATDSGALDVTLMAGLSGGFIPFFHGAVFCALFTKEEWSAAQVLEHYQFCRRL